MLIRWLPNLLLASAWKSGEEMKNYDWITKKHNQGDKRTCFFFCVFLFFYFLLQITISSFRKYFSLSSSRGCKTMYHCIHEAHQCLAFHQGFQQWLDNDVICSDQNFVAYFQLHLRNFKIRRCKACMHGELVTVLPRVSVTLGNQCYPTFKS